jgi:2,4-dienoyl-CoA reductase-like NADH-dependent reductase (Old Yellow Enzyme family)
MRLESGFSVGGLSVPNRLYRAPLLECAGTGPDTADTLIRELEPAAASGTGLIFQGATIVRGEGGCVAPNMTRVDDRSFVHGLAPLPEAIHEHGGRVMLQLEHGGLRSMETWHRAYRDANPGLKQLAVSRPPSALRAADRLGLLEYDVRVLSTGEVRELAADFGRSARYAVEAGYDGIHIAGANMGIVQQFLSPYYNRRDDAFGGSLAARCRFPELVAEEIRDRAGDVPLVTKVPAETAAPAFARPRLGVDDGVAIAERLADAGYDALVPVECSTFWDTSLIKGAYPERAWDAEQFESGYEAAFGSRWRARLVDVATRIDGWRNGFEPAWNEAFCRAVRRRVDVPVLCEGGVRDRPEIDRLLGADGSEPACDAVGIGRPFYAEPRLATRLLDDGEARVVCENCNNCVIPQATGAPGICRTPEVLRERGRLEKAGAYDRSPDGDAGGRTGADADTDGGRGADAADADD